VRERLTEYMQGRGDGDGLRVRLLKLFEELAEERRQHRKRAEQIRSKVAVLKARPKDEATVNEIDQLDRERQKALELVREINQRELLNTLTDAGLIPNYAFPEAGIELKSVLWRRRASDEAGQHAYVTLGSIKYERPAASALSEFAPENRFYANQRRVEVDQINMGLARLEWWRLCPSCHHMLNLERAPDADACCPRCGDAMWSDQSQRRQLLRFRQALANSDDTKVRIDDSADDREPRFHVRQLLADFDPSAIKEAWRLAGAELPFGFEFIASATFRDINFGEVAKPGNRFKVADRDLDRPGFRLCRHCGKVQTPPRSADPAEAEQQHTFDCDQRESSDPADIVDCLYLYREFSSEALRILVPYTRSGMDDEVIQSFMAALQLGLKKRFGGKVDHLRLVTQDEPGRDGGPRRQFVLLYDSIPGGTGYLHQLLARDARTLADVLRLAHDAIVGCSCNQEPGKDGCYRCVYQYRLGRAMELVSRDRARAVLTELLASVDRMERVATISDIFINPHFDSPLEARFIESLRRLSGKGGLPVVRLVQEIVNGKSGFLLEVGAERYWVEPQADLGPEGGIAVASRPDFLIWPVQGRTPRLPVAVFCDGWAYHRDTLRSDARKRSALVSSGRLWVWTVLHEDVKAALGGDLGSDLESPLVVLARHDGAGAPADMPRAETGAFARNAVAQLLTWLAKAPGEDTDAAVEALRRNAAWATFLMIPVPGSADAVALATEMDTLWESLPDWMQALPTPCTAAGNAEGAHPIVRYRWPASFARGETSPLTPGLLLLDDVGAPEPARHRAWREWVTLYNSLQVLPGLLLATRSGIGSGDYEALAPVSLSAPSADAEGSALAQAWAAAIEQAVTGIQAGMRKLASAGCAVPDEVGYEHADPAGNVDAEAELAWTAARLVVVVDGQADYLHVWTGLGWTVIEAKDDWAQAVSAAFASGAQR
jgi:DEAD/DEAH box helicase domain-containing protein